jgi:hypothetical protein
MSFQDTALSHPSSVEPRRHSDCRKVDDALEGTASVFSPGQLQGQGEWRLRGLSTTPVARVFSEEPDDGRYALPRADPPQHRYGSGGVRLRDELVRPVRAVREEVVLHRVPVVGRERPGNSTMDSSPGRQHPHRGTREAGGSRAGLAGRRRRGARRSSDPLCSPARSTRWLRPRSHSRTASSACDCPAGHGDDTEGGLIGQPPQLKRQAGARPRAPPAAGSAPAGSAAWISSRTRSARVSRILACRSSTSPLCVRVTVPVGGSGPPASPPGSAPGHGAAGTGWACSDLEPVGGPTKMTLLRNRDEVAELTQLHD